MGVRGEGSLVAVFLRQLGRRKAVVHCGGIVPSASTVLASPVLGKGGGTMCVISGPSLVWFKSFEIVLISIPS